MTYTLTWLDRRGAGRMEQHPTLTPIIAKLPKLKAEATVRDESGRVVGGVEDARKSSKQTEHGLRWIWWCEPDAKCRNCGGVISPPILYSDNYGRDYCSHKCRSTMPSWK